MVLRRKKARTGASRGLFAHSLQLEGQVQVKESERTNKLNFICNMERQIEEIKTMLGQLEDVRAMETMRELQGSIMQQVDPDRRVPVADGRRQATGSMCFREPSSRSSLFGGPWPGSTRSE